MEIAGAAKGAVDSLLGRISSVLVDEVKLLSSVRHELEFIRDEMESMNSFLLDLQEAKRPSNQQKTWMKQVQELAYAAKRCINVQQALSLREGPRGNGLLGWLPRVRTMRHRRQIAREIQKLKERIEKVNQRRQRYGVEVPKGDKTGQQALVSKMTWFGAAIGADLPVLDEDGVNNAIIMSDGYVKGVLGFPDEANILKECTTKLVKWLTTYSVSVGTNKPPPPPLDRITVIAAPDKEDGGDVAREALKDPAVSRFFENKFWLKVDYMFLLFALNANPQDGVWYALRTMLDNYLPVNDKKELACRDKWDKAQIANEISKHLRLQGARSLILIEGFQAVKDGLVWEWMKEALSSFGCAAGSAAIMITADSHDTILRLHSLNWQVITYSVVEFFYYKAAVVLERNYRVDQLSITTLLDILRTIQERCDQDAFCLKMFVHYLYANPNRTKEEVDKLCRLLVHPDKHALEESAAQKIRETNDKNLLKFCYDDLPRSYKACLMYLAIFPRREKIRRSRLVGRWIVEGLITERDMPDAVREAERCFNTLLNRCFVCPGDIGTAGKVKSCVVEHKLVHELIAKMATEEQFLDKHRPHHLAQHFSVHSSLQYHHSETLTGFMQSLRRGSCINISYISSQMQLVKALDLEGSSELKKENPYIVHKCLKNICNNILLLRYLSLRNTGVTMLPKEINNLILLEILDIRQTRVPPSATKGIMLPKLKCLLAGLPDQIPSTDAIRAEESCSSVQIPRKIKKMPNIEVLSHVEASVDATELKDIGQLWQLRKLGVDIIDNEDHLKKLLQVISDLNECLQSLSIRITPPASSGVTTAPSNTKVPDDGSLIPPKRLESLNIRGITSGQLLPLFFKDGHQLIAKVTLHSTMLKRDDLETSLAKLPNLRCLRLGHKSYIELELTFKKDEFKTLKFLVVDCSEITNISFADKATPKLERIVWSITNMGSLCGIDNLFNLRELELNGECIPVQVQEAIAAHRRSPVLKHNLWPNQGQGMESAAAAAP